MDNFLSKAANKVMDNLLTEKGIGPGILFNEIVIHKPTHNTIKVILKYNGEDIIEYQELVNEGDFLRLKGLHGSLTVSISS